MSKGRPATDTGISIGQVFLGKYRVEQLLGQGGMGIVARCTHLALNEQVAVKMLRADVLSDDDATARFMREAQAAVKLRSEYVARVSDVGTFENGVPYMVMEYLDGQDLGVLLEEQGSVAAQWATDLMLQAAEALAEAHSINIVHRDVKPTNLFVTWRPDGTSLIKVLDFGISKSPMGTDMQLTQTQSLLGTPAYMSPEQMRSARLVDQRTDIWSLGTVLYELLEGHRPFEADSFSEMCVKVAVDEPEPMVNAPPGLQQVVLRCLAKSPDQRYANMAELGRDLIPFARDEHAAQKMVERMVRMLGRQTPSPSWEGPITNTALRTPVPGQVRDFKSGPIARAQSPVAWHAGSDPTAVPLDIGTLREPSAAAVAPIDVTKKQSRSGLTIAVVASVSLAIAAAVMFYFKQGDEPATNVTSPAAAPVETKPAAPPPIETLTAPKPDDKPAAAAAEVPKPADEIKKPEPTPPSVKKPGNKKPKPAVAKKQADKQIEKAKPPKDELAKPVPPAVAPPPTPTPTKRDVYATPRAEK
ncbi:MAG: protein kinase [Myxococcota bacterium]|nr:protein kinase [Myxococcota bacterium]